MNSIYKVFPKFGIFLAAAIVVVGVFSFLPSFSPQGVSISPAAVLAFGGSGGGDGGGGGTAGGGCCGGSTSSGGSTSNNNNNNPPPPPPPPAPTCDMWVSPSTIQKGQSATLSWNSNNASSASINQGIGSVSVDGSVTVSPNQTTTYTGTFTGNGKTVTCSKTITVTEPPKPAPVCTLYASSLSVNKGDSVTLTWSSTNATSASFNQGIGSVPVDGSETVSPTQSTTYTGTFTGNGKQVNCSRTITVIIPHKPGPTCDMWASPTTIEKGDDAELAWSSTNANSATMNQGIGSVNVDDSITVSPDQTTTYTATFTGDNNQKVTCSKTITVITKEKPGPTCDMWVSPTSIEKGEDAELEWNSTNAHTAVINQGIGSVDVDDSMTVSPSKTTTYVGTFYGSNGKQVTCSATLKVEKEPEHDDLSCKLSLSDKSVQKGDRVTLYWESEDADYGSINHGIGRVDEEGSEKVYPKETTTYTGTFYNDDDKVTCKATVKVENDYIPPPHYPQTPYVTLNSVPYTGLDLGPVGTFVYWSFLMLWSVLAAYLLVVKRIHVWIYHFLFGESEVVETAPVTPQKPVTSIPVLNMDPFLASQIFKKAS